MIKIPAGKWRTIIIALAGTLLLALILEVGFNWWLSNMVRRSFLEDPVPNSKVRVAVSWLSIKDIIQAKVNWVQINSWNCKVGKLRYQRLEINSEKITFDLPVLLHQRRLQIAQIHRTRINAAVTETALQEYLVSAYSEFAPRFKIVPTGIQLSGQTSVFGNSLPVVLEGRLGISGPKKLRFFPERLMVAGRPVAPSFLKLIGSQIPLEFNFINEWPLELIKVRLDQGVLFLTLKEFAG